MEVYEIVLIALVALSTIVSILSSLFSSRKSKKTSFQCKEVTTTETDTTCDSSSTTFLEKFNEILKKVVSYGISAESLFKGYYKSDTGSLKLQDVLQKIKIDCLTNGEMYDEEKWTSVIEELIKFSKNVNYDKSIQMDKEKSEVIENESNPNL